MLAVNLEGEWSRGLSRPAWAADDLLAKGLCLGHTADRKTYDAIKARGVRSQLKRVNAFFTLKKPVFPNLFQKQ